MRMPLPTQDMVLTLACLLMLTACLAPSTMRGLRQNYEATRTFTVAQPYATVYRIVLEQARVCYEAHPWWTAADTDVTGDLWPDISRGEVRVLATGGGLRQLVLGIDLAAIDPVSTEVTAYAGRWSTVDWLPVIERWVTQGSEACG